MGSLDRKIRRAKPEKPRGEPKSALLTTPGIVSDHWKRAVAAATIVAAAFNLFTNFDGAIQFSKFIALVTATWHKWVHALWTLFFGLLGLKIGPLESAMLTSALFFAAPIFIFAFFGSEDTDNARRVSLFNSIAPFGILWVLFKVPYIKSLSDPNVTIPNMTVFLFAGILSTGATALGVYYSGASYRYVNRLWLVVWVVAALFAINIASSYLEQLSASMKQLELPH